MMRSTDWNGKRIVVVGAARQGLALARYLARHGARVILTDRRPSQELRAAQEALAGDLPAGAAVEWVCGGHPLSLLDGAGLVCASGGVPLTLPLLVEARERGIPLSNDAQVFMDAAPCKVIGITGSAGKTTTTSLVGQMALAQVSAARAGTPAGQVWVGGNIGTPLVTSLDEMQPQDLAVMELSSFQLELMTRSPQVAAVLNVTPNHLDRHGTLANYRAIKARILAFQSGRDLAVLGRDDPEAWGLRREAPGRVLSFGLSRLPEGEDGTYVHEDALYLRRAGEVTRVMAKSAIRLRGEHNLLNVLAACAVAAAAGIGPEAMRQGAAGFSGVRHRLEFVRSWGGADWYNDSIATAPERAMAAIRSFEEPLVLLAGGRDKNLYWEDFAALVRRRVAHLVVFGELADTILQAVAAPGSEHGPAVTRCAGLRQAVQAAAQAVRPGQVVLLSPGGTSFDEFQDFEERGACFAQLVNDLP